MGGIRVVRSKIMDGCNSIGIGGGRGQKYDGTMLRLHLDRRIGGRSTVVIGSEMANRRTRGRVRSNPGHRFLWVQWPGSDRGSVDRGDGKWHISKFSIGDWGSDAMAIGFKCESITEITIEGFTKECYGAR